MKKLINFILYVVITVPTLMFCISGCSCSVDSGKAYNIFDKTVINFKDSLNNAFAIYTESSIIGKKDTALLSSKNEEERVTKKLMTGSKKEDIFGDYTYDDSKVIKATYYTDGSSVSYENIDNIDFKRSDSGYDAVVRDAGIFEDYQKYDSFEEYTKYVGRKFLEENIGVDKIIVEGNVQEGNIFSSRTRKDIYTLKYRYSQEITIDNRAYSYNFTYRVMFNNSKLISEQFELNLFENDNKVCYKKENKYDTKLADTKYVRELLSFLTYDEFAYAIESKKTLSVLVLYMKSCVYCYEFINNFAYQGQMIYTINLEDPSMKDSVQLILSMLKEGEDDIIGSDFSTHAISTPSILYIEEGKIKYIVTGAFGLSDSENGKKNHDLIEKILLGKYDGDTINLLPE